MPLPGPRRHATSTSSPTGGSTALELELRDVAKRYPGQREPAIPGLSLTVPAGEICALVGPSGSGKTTALRLINRMVAPTGGDILLGGRSVLDRPANELRREIGYVIQQIGLFPHLTIADNVAAVPRLLGWSRDRIAERVAELFELIGLDAGEIGERYPAQLSGGQRQRVGVARALAADPPLMLMDEPFGAIDPINRTRLQDEFLRLQQLVGKTVVFVTHDVDEAIKMGDKIAILRRGGVLAQYASPDEILRRPADAFVAEFVGADRALKRLGLRSVADVALEPWDGVRAPEPSIPRGANLRDALSELLGTGGDLVVVDDHGAAVGVLTLAAVSALIGDDRDDEHDRHGVGA
ncbi:MAG TPA: ABC transporter ATP-binding protein [Solirubrobacteraceae bacterium]|nr:ABC transporter ATP-binding protein [Solirubrobacteraceae bacterium]